MMKFSDLQRKADKIVFVLFPLISIYRAMSEGVPVLELALMCVGQFAIYLLLRQLSKIIERRFAQSKPSMPTLVEQPRSHRPRVDQVM